MLRAGLIQIVTIWMTLFRNHGVVIVGTLYPVPGLSVVGLDLEQSDQIVHIDDRAERRAVQVNVEQVDLALAGKMAVPVHEAGAERLAVHILHAAGAGRGAGGQHGGDGAAFHAHITVEPRVARAVDDLCIAEQNIKHGNAPSHAAESPRRL